MRTFPIKSLWFKTVKGTDLEHLNWDQILECLIRKGLIARVGADRYTLTISDQFRTKSEAKSFILDVLRKELAHGSR